MGNEFSLSNTSSSRRSRSTSPSASKGGKRISVGEGASMKEASFNFFDNLCGSVMADYNANYDTDSILPNKKGKTTSRKQSRYDDTANTNNGKQLQRSSDDADDNNNNRRSRSSNSSGRRPRTSYDDDTASEIAASEMDESTINDYDDDDDTMVTDCTSPDVVAVPASAHYNAKPLASSFAKKCYFTKQGIGKNTQHYEGLTYNNLQVLVLATAMKLKGCPTICDEDLRRVEKTFPNQFSRLPDELMLSSGWRRISKYCHFSNKPIPDGVPFFHSKAKLHPNGGYYFLLASAIGMIAPSDVEPLTRDHLVVLETDYPTQCDAAPLQLIEDPGVWTLVQKFCFFSGGPINTDEDVYYEADFCDKNIYMLAFLSPALTPEELYILSSDANQNNNNQNHPVRMSVDAVRDVESVYDLMERDFEDLKLYHLGPSRALPPNLLQSNAWRKVLPDHFCFVRDRAMERARAFEERYGKIKYAPMHPSSHPDAAAYGNNTANNNNNMHLEQQQMPPPPPQYGTTSTTAHVTNPNTNTMQHPISYPHHPPQQQQQQQQMQQFYSSSTNGQQHQQYLQQKNNEGTYQHPYINDPHSSNMNGATHGSSFEAVVAADVYPRPHDEVEGMDLQEDPVDNSLRSSSKVSVVSFGGDVDVEAGTTNAHAPINDAPIIPKSQAPPAAVISSPVQQQYVKTPQKEKSTLQQSPYEYNNSNNNNYNTNIVNQQSPSVWEEERFMGDGETSKSINPYNDTTTNEHIQTNNDEFEDEIMMKREKTSIPNYRSSPNRNMEDVTSKRHPHRPLIGLKKSPARLTSSDQGVKPKDDSVVPRNNASTTAAKFDETTKMSMSYSETQVKKEFSNNNYEDELMHGDSTTTTTTTTSHNDENDSSGILPIKDRAIYEDEYSVGRSRKNNFERVNNTNRSGRHARSASLSSRHQPQEPLTKQLFESRPRVLSTMNYETPTTRSPSPKVLLSSHENEHVPIVSTKYLKQVHEPKPRVLSTMNYDNMLPSSNKSPSPKAPLVSSHASRNEDKPAGGSKHSKQLHDPKPTTMHYESSTANSTSRSSTLQVSSTLSHKPSNNDSMSPNSQALLSPSTENSGSTEDRSSRRALILKMAKARMQKHKRDTSEPPPTRIDSSKHNLPTSKFSMDLD